MATTQQWRNMNTRQQAEALKAAGSSMQKYNGADTRGQADIVKRIPIPVGIKTSAADNDMPVMAAKKGGRVTGFKGYGKAKKA